MQPTLTRAPHPSALLSSACHTSLSNSGLSKSTLASVIEPHQKNYSEGDSVGATRKSESSYPYWGRRQSTLVIALALSTVLTHANCSMSHIRRVVVLMSIKLSTLSDLTQRRDGKRDAARPVLVTPRTYAHWHI